jgi:enamine deaminase RidA (YjgF/YER057c/UK114 family)
VKSQQIIQNLRKKETILNSIERRIEDLGIILPTASNPAASYTNFVIVNGLMFVSGKGPSGNPKRKLGSNYTTEEGYTFARQTGIEVLVVLKDGLGSLDRIKRVVKVQGFVNAEPHFDEHHKVLNGFSELMYEVFESKGIHARSVFGAVSVRDNLPIIVDSIFDVEE